jgi:hypothetical protein
VKPNLIPVSRIGKRKIKDINIDYVEEGEIMRFASW